MTSSNPFAAREQSPEQSYPKNKQKAKAPRVRRSIDRPGLQNYDPIPHARRILGQQERRVPRSSSSWVPDGYLHAGGDSSDIRILQDTVGLLNGVTFSGWRPDGGSYTLRCLSFPMVMRVERGWLTKAHGLQPWINLPKEHKMCDPQYQELLDSQIPRSEPQPGVPIKVNGGVSHGIQSAVYTRTLTMFVDITMEPHKVVEQNLPSPYTGFIYILPGKTFLGEEEEEEEEEEQFVGEAHSMLTFSGSDGVKETVRIETKEEAARFVFIEGQPLNGPIVQHGPFVMNIHKDIYETFFDFRNAINGFERAFHWSSSANNQSS
ncbi:hypothetical protein EC957_005867 [Mortierella hygrophila]|uniref:Pirin C-terminal domain-containing protein n=1 Tax=Mortierella hygrophila TaxID=979708 RepID=A0A9P6FF14_9FUNG|nr:hypothetical protein EC957_005867 [Mortierella hygrophila]